VFTTAPGGGVTFCAESAGVKIDIASAVDEIAAMTNLNREE
jgi:hypothetical protein